MLYGLTDAAIVTQIAVRFKTSHSLTYNVTETASFPQMIMLLKWYSSLK
jgi:hypothetical protein